MNFDSVLRVLFILGMPATAIVGGVILWKIRELHLTMNSRLDQLIKASLAQGRQDERDSQKGIVKMEEILKDKGLL
jgi:hypothetical protein